MAIRWLPAVFRRPVKARREATVLFGPSDTSLAAAVTCSVAIAAALAVGLDVAAAVNASATVAAAPLTTSITMAAAASCTATVAAEMAASPPGLVQHHSSAHNPQSSTSQTGNALKIRPMHPVGDGNCLVLTLTWNTSVVAPSISDNINGSWGSPMANQPGASFDTAVWVLPDAGAGQTEITVTWSSAIQPFQYQISEFYNIALASPGAGSHSATADVGPGVAAGSFAPTNNDGTGGNLIYAVMAPDSIATRSGLTDDPQTISPGSGFTLISAATDGVDDDIFPRAVQILHQTTAASINPGFTVTGDSSNSYNVVAIALKVANAGTVPPRGIRIVRSSYQSWKSFPTGATNHPIQFPCQGNLQVILCHPDDPVINLDSVTDSEGNTWTQRETSDGESQSHHNEDATPADDMVITLHVGSGNPGVRFTIFLYDIVDADPDPYDTHVSNGAADCSSVTTINNCPTITPSVAPGLALAYVDLGLGPATALASGAPAGAVFDAPTYTGETDSDYLTNAAGLAHLYYDDTDAQHWNWTITSIPNNSSYPIAICFKGLTFDPVGAEFAAAVTCTATGVSALTASITPAAAVACAVTVNAPLTTAINPAAAVSCVASAAAALSTQVTLAGATSCTATAQAALDAQALLAAAPAGSATTSAALSTAITLASAVPCTASVSATLSTAITPAAAATGTASVAGALSTQITMGAAPTCVGTATADLGAGSAQFGALASCATSAAGGLSTSIRCAGVASSAASASGSLSTQVTMATTAPCVATASGSLTTGSALAAASSVQASAQGSLSTQVTMAAAAQCRATVVADLVGELPAGPPVEEFRTGAWRRGFSTPAWDRSFRTGSWARAFKANG